MKKLKELALPRKHYIMHHLLHNMKKPKEGAKRRKLKELTKQQKLKHRKLERKLKAQKAQDLGLYELKEAREFCELELKAEKENTLLAAEGETAARELEWLV